MPGKISQLAAWKDMSAFPEPLAPLPEGAPNIVSTPMRSARVIRRREDGQRELVLMRWGFSKQGEAHGQLQMHARCETVESRPRFCDAFGQRRGIVMAETFNQSEKLPDGRTKQWVVRPKGRKPIALAVIWEECRGEEGAQLTFVMLTAPANSLVARAEDRMPVVLRPEDWPVWLGEKNAKVSEIKALMRTFEDEGAWELAEQDKPNPSKAPKPKPQMDPF
jgi:putative SOS response-associated peptidase YedK